MLGPLLFNLYVNDLNLSRSILNYSKSVSYETLLNIADIPSKSTSTVLDGWSLMVGGCVRDAVAHGGWTDIVGFDNFLLFKTI